MVYDAQIRDYADIQKMIKQSEKETVDINSADEKACHKK